MGGVPSMGHKPQWRCVSCGRRRVKERGALCFPCAQSAPWLPPIETDSDSTGYALPDGIAEITPVRIVEGQFVVVGPTSVERVRNARYYPAGTYSPKKEAEGRT